MQKDKWKITRKYHSTDLSKKSFLITGGAGFIGSNLAQYLLDFGAEKVRILDDLSNGYLKNLEPYKNDSRLEFIEGDITNKKTCDDAVIGMDHISHQAALGSVPRSLKTPLLTHEANATGFLNMLTAAKDAGIKSFIFASSSSVYGDHKGLPKYEDKTGNPLSPYAVSKKTNELYAKVFHEAFGFNTIGLRYFNIFGPNQSPNGPYAAVIPLYMNALLRNEAGKIFGDGEQSRDFTFVENAVQANVKAMLCENPDAFGETYNIACGYKSSVIELYNILKDAAKSDKSPEMCPPRVGDIRDSLANIEKAQKNFNYQPEVDIKEGLEITLEWFKSEFYPEL
ncbi:MAG: UDP-N-acetylglucosamine 4-epimerase [Flavobacteriales bacterium]|jgi:UDP-N-acetylglucosamine 4-epimerase|tara:strand:- start:6414 stop:7430 length:1017 start_codon:yes stop_codon:yes gene_type:complete